MLHSQFSSHSETQVNGYKCNHKFLSRSKICSRTRFGYFKNVALSEITVGKDTPVYNYNSRDCVSYFSADYIVE